MKKPIIGVLIVLSLLVFACAVGKPEKQIPRHLSAGGKQMKKGLEWYQKGCYRKSLEYFFRAYELYSASDVLDGVAMSLNNIGTIHRAMGDCEAAVSFFDEAYATYSDLHDQREAVKALSNKAATLIHMGNLDKAEQVIEEALQVLPAKGNGSLLIPVLQNKGVLLTKREAYEAAEEVLATCLDQADSLDPTQLASLHFAFGNLMLKTGRSADAVASFEKALSIDRELGFYKGMADDLFSMGLAYTRLGQDEKAAKSLKRSIKIFALINQAGQIHETMKHLRAAAQRAGVDISVTEAFVERWRQGQLYESPCRD
jgi:tetratricopeptide (TPR) repeat protein